MMRKARLSEAQILQILKSAEGGRMVKDVCRENSISDATYYNWKAKYGSMEASDIKGLKALEDESSKLKKMFAYLTFGSCNTQHAVPHKALHLECGASAMRLLPPKNRQTS